MSSQPWSQPARWAGAHASNSPWTQGIDGWTSNLPNNDLTTSSCGEYGAILGGKQQLDQNIWVEKTYTKLPAHTGVQLSFDAIFVDSWVRLFRPCTSRLRCRAAPMHSVVTSALNRSTLNILPPISQDNEEYIVLVDNVVVYRETSFRNKGGQVRKRPRVLDGQESAPSTERTALPHTFND